VTSGVSGVYHCGGEDSFISLYAMTDRYLRRRRRWKAGGRVLAQMRATARALRNGGYAFESMVTAADPLSGSGRLIWGGVARCGMLPAGHFPQHDRLWPSFRS